jgi:hypothetical protein
MITDCGKYTDVCRLALVWLLPLLPTVDKFIHTVCISIVDIVVNRYIISTYICSYMTHKQTDRQTQKDRETSMKRMEGRQTARQTGRQKKTERRI